MVPVAPNYLALEGVARADRHCQHITGLGNGLELDVFDEPDITVGDGFGLLSLTADPEGRNSEADLDRV